MNTDLELEVRYMTDTNNTYHQSIHDEHGNILNQIDFEGQMAEILHKFNKDTEFPYKYAEDRMLADLKEYLDNTYSEHYKTDNTQIECFDVWLALGDATPTFRNTAMKYLWRYGKKNGSNKNDLMKALHYTLMCLYNDHYKG